MIASINNMLASVWVIFYSWKTELHSTSCADKTTLYKYIQEYYLIPNQTAMQACN